MTTEPSGSLSFPDGPKLELDQLIDQLVERAQGVKHAQGRLRGLLRAIELVTGELALEPVLRHIVEAACSLAGARYGALGVIAHDGGLERFIHVGMEPGLVEQIGHLPEGKGLLGALINDPRPIRLEQLGADPRSSGFPANHPRMDSFLGVPVRVRGEIFGNLYLTESSGGRFTEEDEELVRSLAVTAGTAISNGRLYQESRLQQRWLAASAEIGAQMLAETGEDPLRMIARHAHGIAGADLVSVGLITPDGQHLVVEVAVGEGSAELTGQRFPLLDTIAGAAIEQRAPILLRSAADAEGRRSYHSDLMETGPLMVIPLIGAGAPFGALTIARRTGRPTFAAGDLSMAAAFASSASVAHELALARSDQQRVALLEDRDRIARDLHDHVIQQLFAIGLSLESVAAQASPSSEIADKIHERVNDIDRTIRQIRTSIFELRGPLGGKTDGLRQRLLEIATELTPALGFSPRIAFSGTIDAVVSGAIADDAAAVFREALANTAKHARATRVDGDVALIDGELVITMTDDGVGLPADIHSSGLANLAARALRHSGSFELGRSTSGGTQLTWKAQIT